MHSIPEDVISYIIGYIGDEELDLLHACNATARIFRPSCQKRLFRSLRVSLSSEGKHESRNERLCDLLTISPGVGARVKLLNINLTNQGAGPSGLKVLSSIPQIRELIVLSGEVAMIRWSNLSEALQRAFSRLFQQKTLEALTLSYIADFPTSVLSGATSLRSIDLDSIHVLIPEEDSPTKPQDPSQSLISVGKLEVFRLTTLTTEDLETVLTDLLHVPSLPGSEANLRELELQTGSMLRSSISSVQNVLHTFTRLQRLVITAGDDKHLDLSALSELKHLSIIFPEYSEDALPWLLSTLQTLPADNKVTSMFFTFWPYETFIVDPDWRELDSELSASGKYHSEIRIRLSGLRHDFMQFLKKLAPKLASRKNVEIFNGKNLVDWRPTEADAQAEEISTEPDDSERDDEE